jgi:hypothetical protein
VGACIYAFASFAIFHLMHAAGLLDDEAWWGRIQLMVTVALLLAFTSAVLLRRANNTR